MRTKEMEDKYKAYLQTIQGAESCELCTKVPVLKDFTHWKLTDNLFPWDRISQTQHMVMPKRHVTEDELTIEEKEEYKTIKHGYVDAIYDVIAEATNRKKSIPGHFHIHLIITKD